MPMVPYDDKDLRRPPNTDYLPFCTEAPRANVLPISEGDFVETNLDNQQIINLNL